MPVAEKSNPIPSQARLCKRRRLNQRERERERERESYILWFDPYQGRNAMIDATFDWILEFQFNP